MADPITLAALASTAAAAAPAAATAATVAATAAPIAAAAMPLAAAAAPLAAAPLAATALPAVANPLVTSMANGAVGGGLLSAPAAVAPIAQAVPSTLLSTSPGFVGPQAPTFMQSAINTGKNAFGFLESNPQTTNLAMRAGGAMMEPPPPPQVLQAPPIQSGQFAPVDFMSLLSQQNQQMPRRTSLLG